MKYEIEQMKTMEDFSKLLNKFHQHLSKTVDTYFLPFNRIDQLSDTKIGAGYYALWHDNRYITGLFTEFMQKAKKLGFIK